MEVIGRGLMLLGVLLIILGLTITFISKFGALPGDIVIRRENLTIFIPITTSLLLSLLLSLALTLLANLFRGR